jgi:hypothetical protein
VTVSLNPDLLYEKQRASLLTYEDARYNSLLSNVPNFYPSQSDYTFYGSVLRVLAQELSRFEYNYSYDVVSLNPKYLTPPDIDRRWSAPLQISGSYPESSQYDLDYKTMVLGLLKAYPKGTTVEAIQGVIQAYTGQLVDVVEMYTLIGNGIVDDSDRNTIQVNLNVNGIQPFSQLSSANLLQTLAQNLYSAIALATPAHIGIDYTLIFGNTEDMSPIIAGMTDKLVLQYNGVEAAPLPPVFTLAPEEEATSPDTELTAWGMQVGQYLASPITAAQYAALSTAYQGEYLLDPDGTYSLNPTCLTDVLVVDSSNNPTGEISKAQGVLAPQLNTSWEIKSDTLKIFRM